jgi:hypothetical protein
LPLLWAVLVALPLGALGSAQYFCHGMGRLVDKCCCAPLPLGPSVNRAGCSAEIKSRDCCERLERASGEAIPALREKAGAVEVSAALAAPVPCVVPVAEPALRFVLPEPIEARAPRPRGPPIFLANCSLLT